MEIQDGVRPTAEDVISKLKDEGDFDSLRLKILRKLKDNDDLRSCIISEVKQSVALNHDGAENLKPRQLSDAVHQEIGNKIMGQISDELWKIIRSANEDGMQNEIRGTVESVYNKLVNPPPKEEDHASRPSDRPSSTQEDQTQVMSNKQDENQEHHHNHKPIAVKEEPHHPIEVDAPPGFASCVGSAKMLGDGSDEDPDVPPGFG